MNDFDKAGLVFLNQYAHQWPQFDNVIISLSLFHQFKGIVVIALLISVCMAANAKAERNREIAIMSILGGVTALFVARLMTKFLPFRDRPMYNDEFLLNYPLKASSKFLENWSAFPSDHAMLWFGISVGIFLISRRVGVVAMTYTVLFICLPRVYLGLHHPTDIIGGIIFGAVMVLLFNKEAVRKKIAGPAVRWSYSHPASSSTGAFLLCYALGTHFEELKNFIRPIAYAFL